MLTLKRADVRFECKARLDSLYVILGQALTGSQLRLRTHPGLVLDRGIHVQICLLPDFKSANLLTLELKKERTKPLGMVRVH